MEISASYLEEQLAALRAQREQLIANLNANQGILQHIELLLQRLSEDPKEIG